MTPAEPAWLTDLAELEVLEELAAQDRDDAARARAADAARQGELPRRPPRRVCEGCDGQGRLEVPDARYGHVCPLCGGQGAGYAEVLVPEVLNGARPRWRPFHGGRRPPMGDGVTVNRTTYKLLAEGPVIGDEGVSYNGRRLAPSEYRLLYEHGHTWIQLLGDDAA